MNKTVTFILSFFFVLPLIPNTAHSATINVAEYDYYWSGQFFTPSYSLDGVDAQIKYYAPSEPTLQATYDITVTVPSGSIPPFTFAQSDITTTFYSDNSLKSIVAQNSTYDFQLTASDQPYNNIAGNSLTTNNIFTSANLNGLTPNGFGSTLSNYVDVKTIAYITNPQTVPEPITFILMSLGLAGMGFCRRKPVITR